jgi:hypothetical protein
MMFVSMKLRPDVQFIFFGDDLVTFVDDSDKVMIFLAVIVHISTKFKMITWGMKDWKWAMTIDSSCKNRIEVNDFVNCFLERFRGFICPALDESVRDDRRPFWHKLGCDSLVK